MEPCVFQQADLLHMICEQMPKGALPRLARVSHALHDSLLPYIWKKLDQKTIGCLTREIGLTAQLAGHFKLHASLVQDLTLDFYRDRRFRLSLLSALDDIVAYAPPTESVLPNLRHLRVRASEAIDLTYTHYFLGPSLYSIEMACAGFNNQVADQAYSSQVVSDLLIGIRKRCKNLNTISLTGMPWLRELPETEALINSWACVTTYNGDGVMLSPRVLSALSRQTNIRQLQMHMQPSQYDVFGAWGDVPLDGIYTDPEPLLSNIRQCISAESFPTLRQLDLKCDIIVATTFLRALYSNLQSITISCSNRRGLISQGQLDALLHSITAFGGSLYDLDLTLIEPFDPLSRRGQPVSWQTFAPLLQCGEIQHFRLTYDTSDDFDFSRSCLSDITRSWRKLESLVLDWDPPARHRTKGVNHTGLYQPRSLTLVDLLRFAAECPHLRDLRVAWLDASSNLRASTDLPTVIWPLRLGVGYGQMECAPDVADFLRKVRPNAQLESRSSLGPEGPRTAWRKVKELLRA